MPLDFRKLKDWKEPPLNHSYGARDCMLYALGVGLGADPMNEQQLRFVYEKGLKALPTMTTVLAAPFGWLYRADAGVTKVKAVHGEQGFRMHKPLLPVGDIVGDLRITEIVDKGRDKGAIVYFERKLRERASGELLCTLTASMFCRADGGFDGPTGAARQPPQMPRRGPDAVCDLPTLPQAALLFRLNGDSNPLHADPAAGRTAGFERPILHGLCAYGVVGHALLKTCCAYDPARLVAMHARFSAPVYPGECIRTEMWCEGRVVSFRAKVLGRDVVALDNGRAEVSR